MATVGTRSPSRTISLVLLFGSLLFFVLPASARADDVKKQLKFDYLDKTLTLRHFYKGEHLSFNADGSLQGSPRVGTWTVDGQFVVSGIRLRGNRLEIKGRRLYLKYDFQNKQFQDYLVVLRDYKGKDREKLEKLVRNREVEIGIDLPSAKSSGTEISSAMKAVFLPPGESMAEIVPPVWRPYFEKQEGKPPRPASSAVQFYRLGSGMSPPHETYAPEPEYSEEARYLKAQGTVVLAVIIEPTGTTRDIQIVTPIGLGLDEKAVAAVSTWKFDPAEKGGEPVPVMVNIEVTFHLY